MELTQIDKPVAEDKDFVALVKSGDYFKQMDCAIQNSPTASMAVLQFKKYCVLPNILESFVASFEKIKHEKISYGFFTLWVEYDADLEVKNAFFRPSKNYRVKKSDDTGKPSEFKNVHTGKVFPAFNKDKTVLKAQIKAAGGFDKFSGQIYQYNTTTQPYEWSPFYPVLDWMKVEKGAPTFVSETADNALFGNNLFIMAKASESSDQVNENGEKVMSNTDKTIHALRQGKSAKNAGSNFVLTVNTDKELDKIFHKEELGNNIDIDKFNSVDDKAMAKICLAAYCFPPALAKASESLFSNSGDAYEAAERIWSSTCEFEAGKIYAAFKEIGVKIVDESKAEADQKAEEAAADPVTAEAQAKLRGSKEGIDCILAIQKAIKEGSTTYESGLAMLKITFGYNDTEATALIGVKPINVTPAQNGDNNQ